MKAIGDAKMCIDMNQVGREFSLQLRHFLPHPYQTIESVDSQGFVETKPPDLDTFERILIRKAQIIVRGQNQEFETALTESRQQFGAEVFDSANIGPEQARPVQDTHSYGLLKWLGRRVHMTLNQLSVQCPISLHMTVETKQRFFPLPSHSAHLYVFGE